MDAGLARPPPRAGCAQGPGGTHAYRGQAETVAALTEEARSSKAMIVSEYRGLKVSELGEIRRTCASRTSRTTSSRTG